MNNCHACQTDNESDAVFCTSCGARLTPPAPDRQQRAPQKPTTGRMPWKMITICGFAIVALIVGLIHYTTYVAKRSVKSEVEKSIPKIKDAIPKISDAIPKISEIIPKSKEEASEIVNTTIGNDQAVGDMKVKPKKLSSRLTEAELTANYNYKRESCADLLTDTLQQGAYVVQGELGEITKISVEEENKIGRSIAKQVRAKFGSKMDKDLQWLQYVNRIGKQLIRHVDRLGIDYHFHVIRNPKINAFAIPGGGIYVYTGLLEKVENEAQLAAILAHEIKHVDLRHCIFVFQMIKQLPQAVQNPYFFTAGKMITNPYSGRQEADADRRGVDLIYSFGYSPYQVVSFWQGMSASGKNSGKRSRSKSSIGNSLGNVFEEVDNVLRSHPPAGKRSCLLKNYIIDLNDQHPLKRVYVGKWNYKNKVTMFDKRL